MFVLKRSLLRVLHSPPNVPPYDLRPPCIYPPCPLTLLLNIFRSPPHSARGMEEPPGLPTTQTGEVRAGMRRSRVSAEETAAAPPPPLLLRTVAVLSKTEGGGRLDKLEGLHGRSLATSLINLQHCPHAPAPSPGRIGESVSHHLGSLGNGWLASHATGGTCDAI